MAFTGKATYDGGASLVELAEDVSDLVGIVSPYETPLLDHLGDPHRAAASTYHEWLEDTLHPNSDVVDDASPPGTGTDITVENASRFRAGDILRAEGSAELIQVTSIDTDTLTVSRGYGGTTPEAIADNTVLFIVASPALEGDDPDVRATTRSRKGNWTQIFAAGVRVSGSHLAARQAGVADELDYQKQERLRELLRDLENSVINGIAPAANAQGSATVRRTMNGIIPSLATNVFSPGTDGFPSDTDLTETQLNLALRSIWEQASCRVDTIVVNGYQKRRINGFISTDRAYGPEDRTFRDMVSVYESDFGVCRVVLSRWVPADTVLLLDSSRIDVLPLAGRHFHYKPLASTGDYSAGEVVGEYTLELRNENAQGAITGLDLS